MSSYSKTLMDAAAQWLAANPDPEDPFLRYPTLTDDEQRANQRVEDAAKVARLRAEAARDRLHDPTLLAGLDELDALIVERKQTEAEVNRLANELNAALNQGITPHQGKSTRLDRDPDLGRWLLAWARHGYNVFELSQDFVAAMLLTDPSELDLSQVRLPFGGVLMTIPSGFAIGAEGGHYTKIHLCEIPRSALEVLDAGNRVAEILKGVDHEIARRVLDNIQADNTSGVRDALASAGHMASCPLVGPSQDPNDNALHVYASDGTHALDLLVETKALSWEAIESLPDSVVDDADKLARHTIRQIVFGTLGFLSASREALEPTEPPRKKARKRGEGAGTKRWTIGRTIRIDPRLVRAARGGAREAAFQIKHRFIVRGHYRNQAHGPNRSLRTSKWIAPFWKGPEEGAKLVHTYKLDDAEGSKP